MTDTLALLEGRRSLPPVALEDPGPSREELDRMLAIAARVPDHGKLVPWRFIVFEGEARSKAGEAIAAAFAADNPGIDERRIGAERTRLARAPIVVAVVSRAGPHVKIPEWEQVLSAGAVCMNLTVAATALGYGVSWITEWYAYDRRVLDALGVRPDEKIAGFIHIGHPKLKQDDRVRPVLADIVTRFGG